MKRLNVKNINTAEYYDEKIWPHESMHRYDKVRLDKFINYTQPGNEVLDLGAGRFGWAEYALKERGIRDRSFRACDFSKAAKEMTTEVCPDLPYDVMDIFNLTYAPESFDMVGAGELIEHLENPVELAVIMDRIVKPNGYMCISTLDHECAQAKERLAQGKYPEHIWMLEEQDLLDIFTPFGVCSYTLVGNYHFMACKKK